MSCKGTRVCRWMVNVVTGADGGKERNPERLIALRDLMGI